MKSINNDNTLAKNYLQKFRHLITEYELVKAKKHPRFRFVQDFYAAHGFKRQNFIKYYNRFQSAQSDDSLLPQKRGPKWKTRCPHPLVERKVVAARQLGLNRYEIVHLLKPRLQKFCPSASGVYNICRRHDLNRLTKPMQTAKRQIVKQRAGELAHADCHYLQKGTLKHSAERLYIVGVVDSCTRLAYAEVVTNLQALEVMFATLRILQVFQSRFEVRFAEMLTDNGPEFGTRASRQKAGHPFERMLTELAITHRYTRPYRPQTNGKAERFWRTLEEELLADTVFDSLESLQDELAQYLYYYNFARPHSSLQGLTPFAFHQKILSSN